MTDQQTTLAELRALLAQFVAARDWGQFHTPKNLAMALAIEAAELMEHFQWRTPDESEQLAQDPQALSAVADELADVVCYALAMANALNLDVAVTVRKKMAKNALKYPVSAIRGRWGHGDPRSPQADS
jgi:NTP pyrophosphatase (non-canonical NTP hydrolase)